MKSLSAAERRRRRGVYVMGVLSLLSLVGFGVIPGTDQKVTYGFVLDNEWVLLHQWSIASKSASQLFSAIAIAGALLAYTQFRRGKTIRLASALTSVGI